jgi:hypothetical protein
VTQVCLCVLRRQIVANLDRGMRGLSGAPPLDRGERSPLQAHVENDLRVTASPAWFTSHLRHTAARVPRGADWGFRVVTDADLMVAWLATAALQGTEILDADARSEAAPVSLTKLTLVDISAPPELLIVRLGVKVARNSAMPEVLYEALTIRAHEGKPTWVWDQPDVPFDSAHLSYSRLVDEFVERWPRVHEGDQVRAAPTRAGTRRTGSPAPTPAGKGGPSRSVRDLMLGNTDGGSRR